MNHERTYAERKAEIEARKTPRQQLKRIDVDALNAIAKAKYAEAERERLKREIESSTVDFWRRASRRQLDQP